MKHKLNQYMLLVLQLCLVVSIFIGSSSSAFAITSNTSGDGYIPFTYNGSIYNIYHHQAPSGDPANPTYDINCTQISGANCSTSYPRYFSSTSGSTGRPGLGTPGTADIYTSTLPQSLIDGSRLYYAGHRASDNGIGCFNLDTATNCGYFPLGSLTPFVGFGAPARTDGIERVGNKLFAIGDDIKMYCLDISDANNPVACSGQPYAVNTGITGQMPSSTVSSTSRLVVGGMIYFLINYGSNSPSANARITCFNPTLGTRCTGWSSLEVTAPSGVSASYSLFEFPSPSGVVDAICTAPNIVDPVQCWNIATQLTVSPPPNMFSGITRPISDSPREEARIGLKTYFAVSGLTISQQRDGFAVCYDFATQARCSGFGTNGYKLWDGSDGGVSINNGDTRDYGYFYNNGCMLALGDSGVLWSFDPVSGAATTSFNCVLGKTVGLPDTGIATSSSHLRQWLYSIIGLMSIVGIAFYIRKQRQSYM